VQSVEEVLGSLADATAGLITDAGGITDADARGPSLLPGWSRGHVLTHLARNAEGGARLLGWARTGVPSYEYPSVAARAAAIEQGAGRPAAELVADVRATAGALAAAAAAMPPGAWQNPVTWTTGQQSPAEMIARSRLAEVLIHHVDLGIGYGPGGQARTAAARPEHLPHLTIASPPAPGSSARRQRITVSLAISSALALHVRSGGRSAAGAAGQGRVVRRPARSAAVRPRSRVRAA
jgi:uncharacterized protein (TIGR03083 family)